MRTSSTDFGYLLHPLADCLAVGGLGLIAFALAQLRPTQWYPNLLTFLLWVAVWPHFFATLRRLYGDTKSIQEHPFLCLYLPPLLVSAIFVIAVWLPKWLPLVVTFGLVWRLQHGAAQAFGISLLYAKRAKFRFSRMARLCFQQWTFSTLTLALISFPKFFSQQGFGIEINLPTFIWLALFFWSTLTGLGWSTSLLLWCRKERRLPPALFLLPVFSHLGLMAAGPENVGYQFIAFNHGLQYLYVCFALAQREQGFQIFTAASAQWLCLSILGGVGFFAGTSVFAAGLKLCGVSALLAPLLGAFVLEFHHYIADAFLWRMRRPNARARLLL